MARLTAASTNCEYPVTIEKHSDVSFLLLAIYETSYGGQRSRRRHIRGCEVFNNRSLGVCDIFANSKKRSPALERGCPRNKRGLLGGAHGIGEHNLSQTVLVTSVGVGDVCFGFLQFGLGELHDGA